MLAAMRDTCVCSAAINRMASRSRDFYRGRCLGTGASYEMGRNKTPPASGSDGQPASDALDLVYVEEGTTDVVYDLAIKMSLGIRGELLIRCARNDQVSVALDGAAVRLLNNRGRAAEG